MNLIDALGPDAPATAFGKGDEVSRPGIQRSHHGLVLHEQPLNGLTGRCPVDGLADGDLDGLPRFYVQCHSGLRIRKRGKYTDSLAGGKGAAEIDIFKSSMTRESQISRLSAPNRLP